MSPVTVARDTGERLFESGRLLRAAERPIRKVGPGRYVVAGTKAPWFVDLNVDPPCACEDSYYRGRKVGMCVHTLACRLQEREPALVAALGALLARRDRHELECVG